jgi:hypothetical protein
MAKIISDKHEIIIFIDDDQNFNENMIEVFLKNYDSNSIKSRWAWRFNSNTYTDRHKISVGGKMVNYCGTGGMVLPSWVFKKSELYDVPEEFKFIEDLWLSYVGDFLLNMNLISIEDNGFINQEVDGKDQSTVAFLKRKNDFMKYLTQEKKWKLKK